MNIMIDANRLLERFAESDPRMPLLVFALLSIYMNEGPFEFNAAVLSERLPTDKLKARINAEEMASLQPELERFFSATPQGWTPKTEIFKPA